jgi:hypothetical protein
MRTESLTHLAQDMIATAAEFQARADEDAEVTALSGAPWCVTTADASLAILVEDNGDGTINMLPTRVEPHLCGFSCFTRRDAEAIAAERGDGYTVTAFRDIATMRATSLRECGEAMIAMLSA